MADTYIFGPSKTLAVSTASVPLLTEDIKPTSGKYQGLQAEVAEIYAVGALYKEYGGGAATTASIPMAAGDSFVIEGYQNIKDLHFIRNTSDTTIVWSPGYR
jgi:hypothetical protein